MVFISRHLQPFHKINKKRQNRNPLVLFTN
jgi:hypothetical protein